jgi:vancomycin resistance protein VanJ
LERTSGTGSAKNSSWWPAVSRSSAHYRIDTPAGVVDLFNIHLASPRGGLQKVMWQSRIGPRRVAENSELRRTQSRTLSHEVAGVSSSVLIVGDFNLPVESAIYRDYWGKYEDAFSRAGWGIGNTFFGKWESVRIDHVLSGAQWRCRRSWVGPDVGSPHRPVIAELVERD